MIVTVSEFNEYSGNYDDDTAKVSIKEMFLGTAESIVIDESVNKSV